MAKFTPPLGGKLSDPTSEANRRNTDQRIRELQERPCVDIDVIGGVELPNGIDVWVSHRLGREPRMVKVSPPSAPGATVFTIGQVVERRGTTSTGVPIDRTKSVVLFAGNYGATITVDVEVT